MKEIKRMAAEEVRALGYKVRAVVRPRFHILRTTSQPSSERPQSLDGRQNNFSAPVETVETHVKRIQ